MHFVSFIVQCLMICNGFLLVRTDCKTNIAKDFHDKIVSSFSKNGTMTKEQFLEIGGMLSSRGSEAPKSDVIENFVCKDSDSMGNCSGYENLYEFYSNNNALKTSTLLDIYPALVFTMLEEECTTTEHEDHMHTNRQKPTKAQTWGYGVGFVSVVVFISNIGVCIGPFMNTKFFKRLLMFCVALAVGTLGATGFLVLIPESLHLVAEPPPVPNFHWKMATVMGGAYFVFLMERFINFLNHKKKRSKSRELIVNGEGGANNHLLDGKEVKSSKTSHPHSHSHIEVVEKDGKKTVAPVAWVLLVGDGIHNFVDGLSIGAAFTESTVLGMSIALAVICEELPHELGDIAILLHAGLKMKKALFLNFLAAVLIYFGLIIGILLGENTNANQWIFGFAGGLFVYLALSDMIPEMNAQLRASEESQSESTLTVFIYQNLGLLCGFGIILCLVVYGGNIGPA